MSDSVVDKITDHIIELQPEGEPFDLRFACGYLMGCHVSESISDEQYETLLEWASAMAGPDSAI